MTAKGCYIDENKAKKTNEKTKGTVGEIVSNLLVVRLQMQEEEDYESVKDISREYMLKKERGFQYMDGDAAAAMAAAANADGVSPEQRQYEVT